MLISETAFYFLGTTPYENRQSLLGIVEELSLGEDEDRVRESYRNLTLSNQRLVHEVSWAIGVPEEIDVCSLIETAVLGELKIDSVYQLIETAPLAFCNLLVENVNTNLLNMNAHSISLSELLPLFAQAYEKINASLVFAQVNDCRTKAKFPLVRVEADIDSVLQSNLRTYISIFRELHKSLPTSQFVRNLTHVIEDITAFGTKPIYAFIEELVAAFRIDVSDKLGLRVTAIKKNLSDILLLLKQNVEMSKDSLDSAIGVLRKNLTAWGMLAKPIQLTYKSQGKEDSDSVELAKEVRSVAITAFNEYGRTDISIKVCEILSGVFADVPTVKAIIDDDQEFLSKQILEVDEHLENVLHKCLHLSTLKCTPEEALKEAEVCISLAKEELLNTDNTANLKDLLVNTLKGLAICLSNEQHAYLAALAILHESLYFVDDKKLKENIEKNLEIIQGNLFASIAG